MEEGIASVWESGGGGPEEGEEGKGEKGESRRTGPFNTVESCLQGRVALYPLAHTHSMPSSLKPCLELSG